MTYRLAFAKAIGHIATYGLVGGDRVEGIGLSRSIDHQGQHRLAGTDGSFFMDNEFGIDTFRNAQVFAYSGEEAVMIKRKCFNRP